MEIEVNILVNLGMKGSKHIGLSFTE